MIDVIIYDVPPSMNEIIGLAKKHWGNYSSLKKKWTRKVQKACPINMFKQPVVITVTYTFPNKRKRDFDNYSSGYKLLGDGLIGRVIKDDSQEHIKELRIRFAYEKGTKKTVINIEGEKT